MIIKERSVITLSARTGHSSKKGERKVHSYLIKLVKGKFSSNTIVGRNSNGVQRDNPFFVRKTVAA